MVQICQNLAVAAPDRIFFNFKKIKNTMLAGICSGNK